mmetsp:Transcript_7973/g.12489  ORF Transcript_7973/g.12489 Transcript_7973/m.12489 type:complete len:204 (+) Transcript_7973:1067-1678(+)
MQIVLCPLCLLLRPIINMICRFFHANYKPAPPTPTIPAPSSSPIIRLLILKYACKVHHESNAQYCCSLSLKSSTPRNGRALPCSISANRPIFLNRWDVPRGLAIRTCDNSGMDMETILARPRATLVTPKSFPDSTSKSIMGGLAYSDRSEEGRSIPNATLSACEPLSQNILVMVLSRNNRVRLDESVLCFGGASRMVYSGVEI